MCVCVSHSCSSCHVKLFCTWKAVFRRNTWKRTPVQLRHAGKTIFRRGENFFECTVIVASVFHPSGRTVIVSCWFFASILNEFGSTSCTYYRQFNLLSETRIGAIKSHDAQVVLECLILSITIRLSGWTSLRSSCEVGFPERGNSSPSGRLLIWLESFATALNKVLARRIGWDGWGGEFWNELHNTFPGAII